jgi:small subunit ribosomal protein S21
MYIEVKGNDLAAFDRAMSEFKRKVKKAEILRDLRKHEYYQKPSTKRKAKRLEALKRRRRERNDKRRNPKNHSRRNSEDTS